MSVTSTKMYCTAFDSFVVKWGLC